MTSTAIAQASILQNEIATAFEQPSKRRLKQHEALAIVARMNGARNANIVLKRSEPVAAPEKTLQEIWDQARSRLNADTSMAHIAISAIARNIDAKNASHAIEAVLTALPCDVRQALLWQLKRRGLDELEHPFALLPSNVRKTPGDALEKDFLDGTFTQSCRDAIEKHIETALRSRHPALEENDTLPSFRFCVLPSVLMPDADLGAKTPRQVAETVVLPGEWRLCPNGGADDMEGGYIDLADVERYAANVQSAFGMDIDDFRAMPHSDLTWIDIYLLAQVQYSTGYEGEYFEGTCVVDHENRTFEFSFGT